jgi:hypothetical protein
LSISDLKRLKEMERELSQLKRMYADMAMENRALKDLIEKNSKAARETRSSDLSGGRAPIFCSAKLSLCRFVSGGILQSSEKPRR